MLPFWEKVGRREVLPEEGVRAALRPWAWGGRLDVLVTQSLGAVSRRCDQPPFPSHPL